MALTRRLYSPTRDAYQLLCNRSHWRERRRLREFLRPFVPRGSLAFDVGAFKGHYAQTLRALGARVVAVEPNPVLADEIRRHFPGIVVENIALDVRVGRARLRIGGYAGHSTLSEEWARAVPGRWTDELDVEVETLDALIARHGLPAFVKIDVEGHEAEVLRGLSTPVTALSFEFQCAAPELAERAVEAVAGLDRYRFALARADEYSLGEWVGADEIVRALRREADADPSAYGDVYARASGSSARESAEPSRRG